MIKSSRLLVCSQMYLVITVQMLLFHFPLPAFSTKTGVL